MKIYVAHAKDFPYEEKLYVPLRGSALSGQHEFILPLEHELEKLSKETIRSCNLLLVEVSRPSLGAGIEMGWADALGVPIVYVYEKDARISSSLSLIDARHFEYEDSQALIEKLTTILSGEE